MYEIGKRVKVKWGFGHYRSGEVADITYHKEYTYYTIKLDKSDDEDYSLSITTIGLKLLRPSYE